MNAIGLLLCFAHRSAASSAATRGDNEVLEVLGDHAWCIAISADTTKRDIGTCFWLQSCHLRPACISTSASHLTHRGRASRLWCRHPAKRCNHYNTEAHFAALFSGITCYLRLRNWSPSPWQNCETVSHPYS